MNSGTLTNLDSGTFGSDVSISTGATLNSYAGGITDSAVVTNSGTFNLFGDDTVGSYTATGGLLEGSGTLTANSYTLSEGGTINVNLGLGTLTAVSGNTAVSGSAAVSHVDIAAGTLSLGANSLTAAPQVVNAGTLNLGGNLTVESYDASAGGSLSGNGILTTSSFTKGAIITEATNSAQLSLLVDANGGDVTLGAGSSLQFSIGSSVDLPAFSAFPLFNNANQIIGDATSIGFETFNTQNLATGTTGVFDVTTGILFVVTPSATGSSNTSAVVNNVLGGEFDSGEQLTNTNGFQPEAQSILVLAASLANADLNDSVTFQSQIQELSPEVYGGTVDYGIRSHLNLLDSAMHNSISVLRTGNFRVFAGLNSYSAETSSSVDGADFDLSSTGGYFGAARKLNGSTRVGFVVGADEGDLTGDNLDLEGSGKMFGVFTETDLNMPFNRGVQWGVLKTSVSFSSFSHDGSRVAQGLTNNVSGIDTGVLQAGIHYRAELVNGPRHKLTPFIGAHYIKAETDAFNETGSINSLSVSEYDKDMLIIEGV